MKGIIVFVKNPELGKVKTRLAQTMGDVKALEIYNKLVAYTRNVLLEFSGVEKFVFYSSFIDLDDEWNNDVFAKRLQTNGGLGEKMTSAFRAVFETCEKVVIIGSDCPQLKAIHIEKALNLLDKHNVVIGPSDDGGYYLLGMDRFYPFIFEGINWSTETVLSETLAIAKHQNMSTALLEKLHDVDFEDDWNKYGF